jgi:NodT family efflux transporter outer membrane factor (OMF) lipoprotein
LTNRISVSLLLLVSGCTAGTDYIRPSTPSAPAWRQQLSGAPAPSGPWWRRFGDPVLNGLIDEALARNPDIESSLAALDRSRAAARAAGAAMRPFGTAGVSATRTRESLNVGLNRIAQQVPDVDIPRTDDFVESAMSTTWEIDLAGGLRRGREAAGYEYEAALASVSAARVALAAEVADAYVRLRLGQSRYAIAVRSSELRQQLEGLVHLRFKVGEASKRELLQAEASTAQARAGLPVFRAMIEAQRNRLAVLAGHMPQDALHELEQELPVPLCDVSTLASPDDLLRRRPDIIAAERRAAAAHARIGVALAEYYPRLSLSSLIGFQSNGVSDVLSGSSSVAQGGIGLRWRLFDFGRVDAQVRDARGAERAAIAAFRATVFRAAEEVETSAVAYLTGRERMVLHESELRSAASARALIQTSWKAGELDLSQVIEADGRLLATQDMAALARGETALSLVSIHRAIAGSREELPAKSFPASRR